jgi:hypothetical protein
VRRAGVRQFLHVYHRLKDIEQDDLLWGEEVEYGIFKVRFVLCIVVAVVESHRLDRQ